MLKCSRFHDSIRAVGPSVAVVTGLVSALCLPHPASAQGGFNGPGRYQITNVKSGKILDLDRNDQSFVVQASARGSDSQVWEVQRADSGFLYLRNAMNGTALEVAGTRDSAPVRAKRYGGGSNQKWRFETATDGAALLVSKNGKALDIPGGTNSEGARVQTYEVNGESNQRFIFRPVYAGQSSGSADRVVPSSSNAGTGRTALKPGWNMFSPQQDVELGQQAAREVAQQVPLLNDSRVDNYLNSLGRRLAANATGFKYPYTYKTVNNRTINAFALPGGNIYINRGVIEAADNEAQLAGVLAHETAHIALRHGTTQASKASAAQLPLAILGGLLGSESTGAALAQLGAGFTVNSILLKYSRDAESQADLLGTQILFDSGLDPGAMGQFFAKLDGGSGIAFFSDHPNPDRRIESVNEEVARLGRQRTSSSNSRDFDDIKRRVQTLPAPRPGQLQSQQQQNVPDQPAGISDRLSTFENSVLRIGYPDNWRTYGQGDAVTIAPRAGIVSDNNGNQALVYGVLVNIYEPHWDRTGQQLQGPGYGQNATMSTEQATEQLIVAFQQSNRNMRVVRRHERIEVSGQRGLSTYLSNDSPIQGGGRETNWLVTLPRLDGLLFFVFTAPERDFQAYENAFQQMLYSARVKQ